MKKNLLALLLGFGFALVLLASLEIFFRINETTHWIKRPVPPDIYAVHRDRDEALSQSIYDQLKNNEIYKWKPLISREEAKSIPKNLDPREKGPLPCCMGRHNPVKGIQFESRMMTFDDHRLVYSAHFTFDSHGRRITPRSSKSDYNVLMFGDSYTLGEGVHDDQSAPYLLGKMRPEAQVYNFGISGGGVNDVLYELQDARKDRLSDIPKKKTIVLYTFMDHHLERLFARSTALMEKFQWILTKPYYAKENDQIVLKGFFDTDRKRTNALYKIWNSSAFLNFYEIPWPPRFSKEHFEFFADVLKSIESTAKNDFGSDTEFYFVLYPGAADAFGPELRKTAEERGLKVLDYTNLDMDKITAGNKSIPADRHPSPVTQFVFAWLLNRDLARPNH
ncbi:MAG TPA: hypothetical protein VF412_14830 [Bdellovibrio sp.]|uniref:hypothetical protein n=1 Tax=Bdellovibrio sp. TaxID=28201 RepID=UPI002F11831C